MSLNGKLVRIIDPDHPMFGFIGEAMMGEDEEGRETLFVEIDEKRTVANLVSDQLSIYAEEDDDQ